LGFLHPTGNINPKATTRVNNAANLLFTHRSLHNAMTKRQYRHVPRKPTLSPSKLTTYLACPAKYYWTYLDPRGKWYLRARSHYSFGLTLHRVLERFHDSGDSGVTTTEEALAALEESWIDAGFSSAQEMQEAMGEGKAIIEAHVARARVADVGAKTLLVEKSFSLDLGPFCLIGRIDRVDEHPDGSLEIIDYKSQRTSVTPEDVQTDLALCCYQLYIRKEYPDRPVRATLLAVRSGEKASHSLSEAEAEELTRDLVFLGEHVLHREYEFLVPTRKPLCEHCDFLSLCRKHPEFDAE